MYLVTSTRCGISAKQLERELSVTYKTAWRMMYLIRTRLMSQDAGPLDSGNPVEVDETYVGGRRRSTRGGRPSTRDKMVPVLGLAQRKGRVVAKVVPNVKRKTVFPHITKHVPATPLRSTHAQ